VPVAAARRSFGARVKSLYHRWQTEFTFPFDYTVNETFSFRSGPGNDQRRVVTCASGTAFGLPCSGTDGHAEIVGWPLAVLVRDPQAWTTAAQRRAFLRELPDVPAGVEWTHAPSRPEMCLVSRGLIAIVQAWLEGADADGDGIPDVDDNCPEAANAAQLDGDADGAGDPCDPCPTDAANDEDADAVCGAVDNCPITANPFQGDADGDGYGDACDACPADAANDEDGDLVCGDVDDCPTIADVSQANADGDGHGDACDACPADAADDEDRDGLCADVDNCASVANASQGDADGDAVGDACDVGPPPQGCRPVEDVAGIRCLCERGLAAGACGGQRLSARLMHGLTEACKAAERAATAPPKRLKSLRKRAAAKFRRLHRVAGKRRVVAGLTSECRAELRSTIAEARSQVDAIGLVQPILSYYPIRKPS
jgi:hypothetical protein